MNISKDLVNFIMFSLDTLIQTAGIDIRLHGLEEVPDQPVVYVINHFTRLETVLMPYLIKKHLHKEAVSLAHESFFSGKMKDFMDNVGAVSTADPHKDKIFIHALLSDRHPVIIFPEGQIIKDKRSSRKENILFTTPASAVPPIPVRRASLC